MTLPKEQGKTVRLFLGEELILNGSFLIRCVGNNEFVVICNSEKKNLLFATDKDGDYKKVDYIYMDSEFKGKEGMKTL